MSIKVSFEKVLNQGRLGLGTAQLGNTDHTHDGVKYIKPELAGTILTYASESGIMFFDTGANYGKSEQLVGHLKKQNPDKVFIATKAGMRNEKPVQRDFSKEFLMQQLKTSLRHTGQETLDLFQLNKPGISDINQHESFAFLMWVKEQGFAFYTGVVVGDLEVGYKCLEKQAKGAVDCILILFNLVSQEGADLVEKASQAGVKVIARSPLNSGLLSVVYTSDQKFDKNDERKSYFSGDLFHKRLETLQKFTSSIGVRGEELLNFSLNFLYSFPGISMVIPGASNLEQLKNYLSVYKQTPRLTISKLEKVKMRWHDHYHDSDFSIQN